MKAVKNIKKVAEVITPVAPAIVAIVMNGKYVVRTYSLEDHGDSFAELANEFAGKKGYQVELK